MKAEIFAEMIHKMGIDTMVGVPDSTLKQFCDYMNTDGKRVFRHYVPENEGAAVGIAIGTYLSTQKPACLYMQNSGIGNIVNPVTSLANKEVYDIPMLLLIGWRGEPGVHDEPQHKFMGRVTKEILNVLEIPYSIVERETSAEQLEEILADAGKYLTDNRQYALIIKRDTFEIRQNADYSNEYSLVREEVIREILKKILEDDVVISTTGKISREVYEQSDKILGQHAQEFLTVGGMGHASMIAFGIAANMQGKRVLCLDGDGAVLMHMGSLAFIGKQSPENLIHICFNNNAHESVGGMPTGAAGQSYARVAEASGYRKCFLIEDKETINEKLDMAFREKGPVFIEIRVSMNSRSDLGRPKESAVENKEQFMRYHEVTK